MPYLKPYYSQARSKHWHYHNTGTLQAEIVFILSALSASVTVYRAKTSSRPELCTFLKRVPELAFRLILQEVLYSHYRESIL